MNHLDEGTIHAWLDGALDAARARDAEAHVAACAECAAAVAEARGLIAGASRILGALDDVPGGVIPARPAPLVAGKPAPARARRLWRAAPWVTGIAAVLMAAVVLRTGTRAGRMAERQEAAAPTAAPVAVLADSNARETSAFQAPERAQAASQSVGTVPPAATTDRARTSPARPQPRLAAPSAVAQADRAEPRAPALEETANRPITAGGVAGGVGKGRVAAAAGAAATDSTRLRTADVGAATDSASRVMTAKAARDFSRATLALDAVVVTAVPAESDSAAVEGCYRIDAVSDRRARDEAAAAETRQRARAASAPAAAPSAQAERSGYVAQAPAVVRLDSATALPGLVVRDASSSRVVGRWSVVGDSVRLDLGARGVLMLPRSAKVVCP